PEGQVRLMDFGQAVRTRSRCGSIFLRYFRAVGKPYYRGPECYVPPEREARIVAPPGAAPGRVVFERLRDASGSSSGYMCEVRLPDGVEPGKPCTAELFGYEVPPIDIFALGVCLFILAWRAPPWGRALVVDPSFAFIHARGEGGIPALLKHWQKSLFSEEAMLMLVKMVSPNPSLRPTAEECLAGAWFAPLYGLAVPSHRADDVVAVGAAPEGIVPVVAPSSSGAETLDLEMADLSLDVVPRERSTGHSARLPAAAFER
ncbi:unnamed protein product, partial [Polarella glacialis]